MHEVQLLEVDQITHNVRRYRMERPEGYDFVAGQATEVALAQSGWQDEKRPFTFTGLSKAPFLEFVIKSYTDHDGVTNRLGQLATGDRLLIDDPWETVPYNGTGTFIAGGAGITPFLALLRWLKAEGRMEGHRLIFSNTLEKDIILRDELESMDGLDLLLTVTGEEAEGLLHERVDEDFVARHVTDTSGRFYLCGPDEMTEDVKKALTARGVDSGAIVIAG